MKNGWQTKTLGDLCEISSALVDPRQQKYQKLLHVGAANIESTTGRLIALRTAKDEGLISGKFLFDESTVLYSKIRPYLMKVARPDFKGLCSADIYPLVPRDGLLDRGFLYYVLLTQHFTDFAVAGSARAGMPKVNREHLFAYSLAVPPLPEQRRIVGLLDEAFAGLATAQANAAKNHQNARALFESHLQAVFTQRGKGWVEKRLGEVAESISTGPFGTMLHKSDYVADGIPLVNPMNIVDSRIVPSNRMMVNEETRERLRSYVLKAGDVVIGRRGELGRCALVTEREEGWLCGTGSCFVRLSDSVDGRFFVAVFGSQEFRSRLEGRAVGTTMSNLNHGILRDLRLPVPPIDVQRKVMARADELLSKTQRLVSVYERKLAALEALKKSLLHQAFTGEL